MSQYSNEAAIKRYMDNGDQNVSGAGAQRVGDQINASQSGEAATASSLFANLLKILMGDATGKEEVDLKRQMWEQGQAEALRQWQYNNQIRMNGLRGSGFVNNPSTAWGGGAAPIPEDTYDTFFNDVNAINKGKSMSSPWRQWYGGEPAGAAMTGGQNSGNNPIRTAPMQGSIGEGLSNRRRFK
jgi:hypothetical protein